MKKLNPRLMDWISMQAQNTDLLFWPVMIIIPGKRPAKHQKSNTHLESFYFLVFYPNTKWWWMLIPPTVLSPR